MDDQMDRDQMAHNLIRDRINKLPKLTRDILNDIEMDDDLEKILAKYKDKSLTPTEMDLMIQADRVLYVINRCLAKLEVLSVMPTWLDNDAAFLKKYFPHKDYCYFMEILNRFDADFKFDVDEKDYGNFIYALESTVNIEQSPLEAKLSGIDKIQSETNSTTTASMKRSSKSLVPVHPTVSFNPNAAQIMDTLFYNKCIKSFMHTGTRTKVDHNVKYFIKIVQDLRNIYRDRLYVTGDEENNFERLLRRTYKSNVLLTKAIRELLVQLDKQRHDLGEQLNRKVSTFKSYTDRMDAIKEDFLQQMEKCLHESEKLMMQKCLESEQIQAQLVEESGKVVKRFESLLEENLLEEKLTRAKRLKIETQLQNWLNTYDTDIGEKQSDYETLKAEYDGKLARKEEMENQMDEQEEEYLALMEEKRLEEERIHEEMAYQFLLHRNARMIQRYWRAYRERKLARKKGRRGKGKEKKAPKGSKPLKEKKVIVGRTGDALEALDKDKKIKSHVFEDLADPHAAVFSKKDLTDADL